MAHIGASITRHVSESFPARRNHEELVVDYDLLPFAFAIMINDRRRAVERRRIHHHDKKRSRKFQPINKSMGCDMMLRDYQQTFSSRWKK
jgi:hypothetical protein